MNYLIDESKPKRQRDWEGRFVRLKRDLKNEGGKIFTAGSIMKVRRYHGKMSLETIQMCDKCGQGTRPGIVGNLANDVELLDRYYEFRGEHFPVKAKLLYEIVKSIRDDYPPEVFTMPGGDDTTLPDTHSAAGARIACDLIEKRLREILVLADTEYSRHHHGVKI